MAPPTFLIHPPSHSHHTVSAIVLSSIGPFRLSLPAEYHLSCFLPSSLSPLIHCMPRVQSRSRTCCLSILLTSTLRRPPLLTSVMPEPSIHIATSICTFTGYVRNSSLLSLIELVALDFDYFYYFRHTIRTQLHWSSKAQHRTVVGLSDCVAARWLYNFSTQFVLKWHGTLQPHSQVSNKSTTWSPLIDLLKTD